jgi:hypothetical protein
LKCTCLSLHKDVGWQLIGWAVQESYLTVTEAVMGMLHVYVVVFLCSVE